MGGAGGGEPPIHRAVKPDQCEGNRATRNLARAKGVREKQEGGRREGRQGTLEKCKVSDSREGGE
jgi:hypothetical protein